jgi:type II secretion system protein L
MNEPLLLHIPTGANLDAAIASFKLSLPPVGADGPHTAPSLIVLVCAALVPRLSVTLPSVPPHKLRHAAAYAIEDRLVGDIESQHLSIVDSQPAGGGRIDIEVAAIDRDWLSRLLATLDTAGLKPIAVYADADCIASKPGDVLLWIDGADTHWITPAGLRRTWPVDALHEALDWSLGATPAGTLGLRVYASAADLQQHGAALDALRTRLVSVQLHAMEHPLEWLSRELAAARPHNLLHSEFAPQQTRSESWQRWRWPLRVAATIFAVFLAQIVLDLTMASSRARTLEERIAAQASALLPPGSSSTNVVPLLERQLLATTSRSAPSPTLDTLNSLVNASRGNASGATSMKLDSIDLQPGRATLRLGGAAPEELAAWRAAWSAAGWQISEGNDPQGALVIELVRP